MSNLLKEIEGTNKMSFPVFQKSLHFLPQIVNVLFVPVGSYFFGCCTVQLRRSKSREVLFCTRNI